MSSLRSCHTSTQLNTNNSEIGLQSRDCKIQSLTYSSKVFFLSFLALSASTPWRHVHPIFENFDSTMVLVPSRLWRGCGYRSSILDCLKLYLRRDLEHNVRSSLPKPLFRKVDDRRAVAAVTTVPWPSCFFFVVVKDGVQDLGPTIPGENNFFSFFLSWVSKTQPNHWTKRMVRTRLAT